MSRKLIIDPVTRIEGHGKVTVHLDDDNNVVDARLHVVEFRGFEKFVQGHPFWEAPMLMQRICGICFVSHHLCGAKALDDMSRTRKRALFEYWGHEASLIPLDFYPLFRWRDRKSVV